jgi:hypothetical protein
MLTYIIDNFYTPSISSYPGQLISGFKSDNVASRLLHERLGFKPVAIAPQWQGADISGWTTTIVFAAWTGAGEVPREDSIFAGPRFGDVN